MSSTYRLICMSHDPATVLYDEEWHSGTGGRETITVILDNLDQKPYPGHKTCALIGGRFSYPLIEVYDPNGLRIRLPGDTPGHNTGEPFPGTWTDARWLALALAAINQPDLSPNLQAAARIHRWPGARLRLLRRELSHYYPDAAPDA